MTTIKAHFDGKTFVPDEPVDASINQSVTVLISSNAPVTPENSITGVEIANSGFAGLWEDRTDITDSLEYARQLRRQAETRGRSNS